jgi:beta-glucosidase-like glycosyl hydrolase
MTSHQYYTRNDWGYDGIIRTDWEGAKFVQQNTPTNEYDIACPLVMADNYYVAENIVSGALSFPLNKKGPSQTEKLWAREETQYNRRRDQKIRQNTIMCEEHVITPEASRKGIVLAKNDEVDEKRFFIRQKQHLPSLWLVHTQKWASGGGWQQRVTPDQIITHLRDSLILSQKFDIVVTYNY